MHSEKSERRTKDESPARHLVAGACERAESPSTGAPGGQPLRLACAAWGLLGLCLLALPLRVGAAVPTGTDRTALEALYDATDGENSWTTKTNWKTTDGDWHGVTTDVDGKVLELDLSRNKLTGTIPDALGDLSLLQKLSLNGNQLSGAIPAALETLTALTDLRLYNNGRYRNAALSGPLPTSFTNLTALKELHAQNTYLTVPTALNSWASALTVTTGTAANSGTIALDAANTVPTGVWANATTLYVPDSLATKVFAYRLADGRRDAAKDITLDPGNTGPSGLWGNETTLWVADLFSHKLYAYRLATRSRASAKDIALEEISPRALWSDGTTVWVVDSGSVYAYTLETP